MSDLNQICYNNNTLEEEKIIDNIKSNIELDEEKLSEFIRKRDNLYKNALNNIKEKDIYYDYLKIFYNNEKNKLEVFENQYKLSSNGIGLKSNYKLLKEYENQIRIRDKVINENNLNEMAESVNEYLSLDKIRNERIPLINKVPYNARIVNKTPNLMPKQKSQLKLPVIHNISSAKQPNHNKNLNNYYYMNQYLSNYRSNSNNYVYNKRTKTNPNTNKIKKTSNNEQSSLDDKSLVSNNVSRNENSELFEEHNRSRDELRNKRQNIFNSKENVYYINNNGSPTPNLKKNNFSKLASNNNVSNILIGKDFTAFAKKKDLNLFYNEKQKIVNGMKKPFK